MRFALLTGAAVETERRKAKSEKRGRNHYKPTTYVLTPSTKKQYEQLLLHYKIPCLLLRFAQMSAKTLLLRLFARIAKP